MIVLRETIIYRQDGAKKALNKKLTAQLKTVKLEKHAGCISQKSIVA